MSPNSVLIQGGDLNTPRGYQRYEHTKERLGLSASQRERSQDKPNQLVHLDLGLLASTTVRKKKKTVVLRKASDLWSPGVEALGN